MSGSGGNAPPNSPPSNGGEFLLSLLQRPPHLQLQTPSQSQSVLPSQQQQQSPLDPAVAAMGPSLNIQPPWPPSNGPDFLHHKLSPPWPLPHQFLSSPIPPNFLGFQNPQNSLPPTRNQFSGSNIVGSQHFTDNNQGSGSPVFFEDLRKLGFSVNNDNRGNDLSIHSLIQQKQQEINIRFGSFPPNDAQSSLGSVNGNGSFDKLTFGNRNHNGLDRTRQLDPRLTPNASNSSFNSHINLNSNSNVNFNAFQLGDHDSLEQEGRKGGWGKHQPMGNYNATTSSKTKQPPPPGFPSSPRGGEIWDSGNNRRGLDHSVHKEKTKFSQSGFDEDGVGRFSHEETLLDLHREVGEVGSGNRYEEQGRIRKEMESVKRNVNREEADDVAERLVDSLLLDDEPDKKNGSMHHHRDKDYRLDNRGQQLLTQRMRFIKQQMQCRGDIDRLNVPLLAIYESLIPPDEEKAKQKQLLTTLERLVITEWPKARLYLYGSCANSFGVSKSDIDVCLALEGADINKSEVLLKLAEILEADNLQNVQALTRARVPIVKLMDPATGISCDICINNVLAVVNTKLLADYANIDVRLRQLAFLVKHWAKSRGVNETYQGTLSSYAYVLMCIHFLQQRRPAILPCLQGMKTTYSAKINDIECAFFDQVEKLHDFGSYNKETIAQLVWAFFNYWAYSHDYTNAVISVRTGSTISKRAKDWTRRIGNDRHLICIEDPFETSHDLGRVVDKYSIKVLREEFERAADILQYDPNPCVKLFEPYVPS